MRFEVCTETTQDSLNSWDAENLNSIQGVYVGSDPKIGFKSELSHSSQYPRAAMLWIGEVEDEKSIDELISSASITGRSIPDFENLDFKIASGLRKILTGNFKKQVTTAEGTS